jgi:Glycosyl hydrolase family 71
VKNKIWQSFRHFVYVTLISAVPVTAIAAPTPSVNGANIPALASIIDSKNNTWTVVSGVVKENGQNAGFSGKVNMLLYKDSVIYQRNISSDWWSWSGTTWTSVSNPLTASASNTNIPAASLIIDTQTPPNAWALSGGVVYENGKTAGFSGNVIELLFLKGVIYQENSSKGWWSWNGTAWVTSSNPVSTSIADPCLPFTMPSATALFSASHRTFTHYFYPFPLSIDNLPASEDYYARNYLNPKGENNAHLAVGGFLRTRPLPVTPSTSSNWQVLNMQREVRMALARGITGFEIDLMSVTDVATGGPLPRLVAAAQAVDSRFQILLMPDMSALKGGTSDVITIVKAAYNSPGLYHDPSNGHLVISPFCSECATPTAWTSALNTLAAEGMPVAFYPTFTSLEPIYVTDYKSISVGLSQWATPSPSQLTWYTSAVAAAKAVSLPLMEGLGSQEYRPYASLYYEANNSLAYRNGWTGSLNANLTVIDTWSDLSEGAQIEPVTDLDGTSGNGYYNLTGYYTSWYASKVQPVIDHDVLYYFYRKEPTTAVAPSQTSLAKLSFGTATNEIELLAFLTAPGTLTVTIDGKTYSQSAPAGMTSFMVPTAPGIPKFSLVRNGAPVISFQSGPQIYGAGGLPTGIQDLTYWSGSASVSGVCSITPPDP